jgi:hypothetical protein
MANRQPVTALIEPPLREFIERGRYFTSASSPPRKNAIDVRGAAVPRARPCRRLRISGLGR